MDHPARPAHQAPEDQRDCLVKLASQALMEDRDQPEMPVQLEKLANPAFPGQRVITDEMWKARRKDRRDQLELQENRKTAFWNSVGCIL